MTRHTLTFTGVVIPNTTWHAEVTCMGEEALDSTLASQVIRQVLGTMRDAPAERIAADLAEDLALRMACTHVDVSVDFSVDGMPGRYAIAVDRDTAAPPAGEALPVETVSRGAVIAMESAVPNAEDVMRAAIVAIDGIPGTQVEGISPLYHVTAPDGHASYSAVIALHTTMSLRQLHSMLQALHGTHEGAVQFSVVAMDGEHAGLDRGNARRAAVLAPWMDMDPDATVDGDPLAFALAGAPDAPFVGLASDHWIIGGGR